MKTETKVGLLFLSAFVFIALFAYYLGAFNPFTNANHLTVAYNFAGGIEVGSPVRVMGIKVGKVKDIAFDPEMKAESGEEVKLKLMISIDKKAWKTIRKDSRFHINLAGVIGEKFIEITPGSLESPPLQPGDVVRGEDPPRIDQLISQSYGLAGKILEIVDQNKGTFTDTLERMESLVKNLNKTMILLERMTTDKQTRKLLQNVTSLTGDLATITAKMTTAEAEKTYKLLNELLWRLEGLDAKTIRKFLQEEGIKAKIF